MNSRNLKVALFLLIGCSFIVCNESQAQEWARKMFTEHTHSFGKVPLGEIPEYRFEIKNIYKEDIHIQSVTSSCGCTIATATKKHLKMFEKGEIVCRFNTPAVGTGFKQATVTIRFAGQFAGEAQLTVNGTIVGGLNFNPESIDFGQVTLGKMPSKTVQLTHTGNPRFDIVDIKSTFGHIKVQKQVTARRGNYVSFNLTSQLTDSAPVGYLQGELFLIYTEDSSRRDRYGRYLNVQQKALSFTAKVEPPLKIAPSLLSLGTVKPGQKVTHKAFLTADVPFKIQDVKCPSGAFSVRADRDAKKVHIVEITYTGEEDPGKHECELSFYTDLSPQSANASGVLKAIVEIQAMVGEVTQNK